MSYHRCPKCASDRVMDGAYMASAESAGKMIVGVRAHPDHGPLDRAVSTGVHASVCGSCGYVELWANRPEELWEHYHAAELRARARARTATAAGGEGGDGEDPEAEGRG